MPFGRWIKKTLLCECRGVAPMAGSSVGLISKRDLQKLSPAIFGRNELRGLGLCGQATKGTWGMSWRQKALKGVENCEKPGEVVKRALIPGFPNRFALNS